MYMASMFILLIFVCSIVHHMTPGITPDVRPCHMIHGS